MFYSEGKEKMKKFRFLIINTDYGNFIEDQYKINPKLMKESFEIQYESRMSTLFGTADFYSRNLKKLGHDSIDIIYNHKYIQKQWVKENFPLLNIYSLLNKIPYIDYLLKITAKKTIRRIWFDYILEAQIQKFQPDIIYNMAMESVGSDFFKKIRKKCPFVKAIIGQHASLLRKNMQDLSQYDLILSAVPAFVKYFREKGVKSEYFRFGFEPSILKDLRKQNTTESVVFVGGLNGMNQERTQLIEFISEKIPDFKFYGMGVECLHKTSPILKKYCGERFGLDMYSLLFNSEIAINQQDSIGGGYACNMRLYETTGVGVLVITDDKKNLPELFMPGKEVITYKTPQEAVRKIKYYLKHKKQRVKIAKAGQRRTLKEHTYLNRMKELIKIINKNIEIEND